MGKYQNGIETQEKILDACHTFFYEKGYQKTTFKDISRATGINQSAIHYHFKSKENLLKIIYQDTVRKNNELVEFYSDNTTSFLAKLFFDSEIYMYKIYHDERYRRFYIDATKYGYGAETELGKFSYQSYNHVGSAADSNEEAMFNRMACAAFDQVILLYIHENIDTVDMEKVCCQVRKMYKKILEIGDQEYEKALEELKLLKDRCKWKDIDTTL